MNLKFLQRKKWISNCLMLAMAIVGLSTIAGKESQDPLDVEMSAFEKAVDQVILDTSHAFEKDETGKFLSGSLSAYFANIPKERHDKTIDVNSAAFQKLIPQIREMKKKIDAASLERSFKVSVDMIDATVAIDANSNLTSAAKDLATQSKLNSIQGEVYGKFAGIILRYYLIQKRIYLNQARNAHKLQNEKMLNAGYFDDLNLKLNLEVGGFLVNNPVLKLTYNLWHTRNPETHLFDLVELGITPEEKDNIEQVVLEEVKDYPSYVKLIHFLSTRERIINQWAVERMSNTPGGNALANPNLKSCSPELMSFKDRSNGLVYSAGNFYDFLWKKDRYDEFAVNGVLDKILPVTLNRPILKSDELEKLLFSFFDSLGHVQVQDNAPTAQDDLFSALDSLVAKFEPAKIQSLHDIYSSYIPNQLANIENKWKDVARAALLDANFMEDRWDHASVADRTSLYAFQFRRKTLIDLLFYQAVAQKRIPSDLKSNEFKPWYSKAVKAVDQFLVASGPAWIKTQNDLIMNVLNSPAVQLSRLARKDKRLEDMYQTLKPTALRSAEAAYVKSHIANLEKLNIANGSWKSSGKTYFNKSFELGFIPAKGRISPVVYAWKPDQILSFFYQKVKFWSSKVDDDQSYLPALAREIQGSRPVMWGMQVFFQTLNNNYMKALQARKLDQANVTRDNSPLYGVMIESVQTAQKAFSEEIAKAPPTQSSVSPNVKSTNPYSMIAVRDNTQLKPIVNPDAFPSNYVTPEKRKKAMELFVQAMSVLNVGELLSTNVQGMDSYGDKAFDKMKPTAAQIKFNAFRANTFLRMELLNRSQGGLLNLQVALKGTKVTEAELRSRIFQSLLDQRIFATGLAEQAEKDHPLLAIQYDGRKDWLGDPDVSAPSVLDLMSLGYTPSIGFEDKKAKHAMVLGLNHAVTAIPGLIKEACIAKPTVQDNPAFVNIFNASRALRRTYTEGDSQYQALDDQVSKFTRTPNQRLLDTLNKVAMVFMAIMIIALLAYCPVLISGVANMVATGSLSIAAYSTGAAGASTVFGMLGEIKSVSMAMSMLGKYFLFLGTSVGGIGTLLAIVVAPGVFAFQLAVQYKVGCVELPNQLRYQLRVANAQVGEYSQTQIAKEDLQWLSANIHQMYVSAQINAAFQLLFVPQLVKMGSLAVGSMGLKVLDRFVITESLENTAAAVAKQSELLKEVSAKSLNVFIAEEGKVNGLLKFLQQQNTSFWKNGRALVLKENLSPQAIQQIMAPRLARIFKGQENLTGLISARNLQIETQGQKLLMELEKMKALDSEVASLGGNLKWYEYGFKNAPSKISAKISSDIKSFFSRYLVKNNRFKVVMDLRVATKANVVEVIQDAHWVEEGKFFAYLDAENMTVRIFDHEFADLAGTGRTWIKITEANATEFRSLVMYSEMQELAIEKTLNESLIKKMSEHVDELMKTFEWAKYPNASLGQAQFELEVLERFFDPAHMSQSDWVHARKLFNWMQTEFGSPFNPFKKDPQALSELKQAVADGDFLMSEIQIHEMNAAKVAQVKAEAEARQAEKEYGNTGTWKEYEFEFYNEHDPSTHGSYESVRPWWIVEDLTEH